MDLALLSSVSSGDQARRTLEQAPTLSPHGNARRLLEDYSGVPTADVDKHILKLRDDAFRLMPYEALGQMRFLTYDLPTLPVYRRLITRLKQGATLLDAGCCIGQELRYIINHEQIPAEQLYGFDIEPRFIELGFYYFSDREALGDHFSVADVLENDDDDALRPLDGSMDIVLASALLHLWDWDRQVQAAARLTVLTRRAPGAMVVGRQPGSREAGESATPAGAIGNPYWHNESSMHRLWEAVGKLTGTEWDLETTLTGDDGADMAMISFCATRRR